VTAGGRWLPGRLPACTRLWPVAGAGNDVRTFVLHGVDVSVLPLAADVAYGDVVDEEPLVAAFDVGCQDVTPCSTPPGPSRRGSRTPPFSTLQGEDESRHSSDFLFITYASRRRRIAGRAHVFLISMPYIYIRTKIALSHKLITQIKF
jgi:hypothetical protein